MIAARRDVVARRAVEIEGQSVVVEARAVIEHEPRQRPEALADPVELGFGIGELEPQPLVDVLVEVLEELPARIVHSRADAARPSPPGASGTRRRSLPVCGIPGRWRGFASRNPRPDSMRAEHFVGSAEDAVEQAELLGQQLKHAAVGLVALVQEVDDDDVVLLPVAMAAADALLDPLRVPGQIVVDDQRAELQVDAFGRGFGCEHDRRVVAEMLDQARSRTSTAREPEARPVSRFFSSQRS